MHLQISTAIRNINIQVQNPDRTFFGVHFASNIYVFFYVKLMAPWARIPLKISCQKNVTGILTILAQKVASSENPTAPQVTILFVIIGEILICGVQFSGIVWGGAISIGGPNPSGNCLEPPKEAVQFD